MIKTFIFFLLLILCINVRGQVRVLVFTDTVGVEGAVNRTAGRILQQNAPEYGLELVIESDPGIFRASVLKDFSGVLFLNTSANKLDFRQAAELWRFFKAGGGFAGVRKAASEAYRWPWYGKMINAQVSKTSPEAPAVFDLITNASIGKMSLPPLWKLTDQPLFLTAPGTTSRPVLIDLSGRACAWYGNTDWGSKVFYTAFGGTSEAFNNSALLSHIFSGLREVCPDKLPDYNAEQEGEIPSDEDFLVTRLTGGIKEGKAFRVMPDGHMIILASGGLLLKYDAFTRGVSETGRFPLLELCIDFTLDPEFETNGYVYFYTPPVDGQQAMIRARLKDGKPVEVAAFGSQPASGMMNKALAGAGNSASGSSAFPSYYDGKLLYYDNNNGLMADSRGERGDLLFSEPVLQGGGLGAIKDIEFGADGTLYLLEAESVKKVLFNREKNFPPVALALADVNKGPIPLKVTFSAGESGEKREKPVAYKWIFSEKEQISQQNTVYVFRKAGVHKVWLEVTGTSGLTDKMLLEVTAEPPGRKK